MHSTLSNNSRVRQWTKEEIEILKLLFFEGKRTKMIAHKIGRSETAVNKFLNRAGLRKKYSRQLIETSNFRRPKNLKVSHNTVKRARSTRRWRSHETPADIVDVINYIKSKGYKISKSTHNLQGEEEEYLLNNESTSAMKLLLLANRLRIETRQPIFSVSSLMWH